MMKVLKMQLCVVIYKVSCCICL